MKIPLFLSLVTLASTATLEKTPTFSLVSDRSANGSPIIDVTFPNGVSDTLVLREFDAGIDHLVPEDKECRYIGHLASEPEACLALTGCPGLDHHVELTILSEHFPGMFKWYKDGRVENIKSPHKSMGKPTTRAKTNDALAEDPVMAAADAKAAKACAAGNCKAVPTTNNLSVRFGYGDHFREKVGGTNAKAEAYWKSTLAHIQTYFCHSSLGSKVKITTLSMKHYKGVKLTASEMDDIRMVNTTIKDLKGADLMVYYGHDKLGINKKTSGVAHLGAVCDTRKYGTGTWEAGVHGYKHSLTKRQDEVVTTAWIAAHEIGHNLGMRHDFDPAFGGSGSTCDKQRGIMSYTQNRNFKTPWSTCSKNEFQKHYNAILNLKMTWCLEAVTSNFCSTSGTGGSTTKATTKATTTKATTKAPTTTTGPGEPGPGGGSGEGGPGDYNYYD